MWRESVGEVVGLEVGGQFRDYTGIQVRENDVQINGSSNTDGKMCLRGV